MNALKLTSMMTVALSLTLLGGCTVGTGMGEETEEQAIASAANKSKASEESKAKPAEADGNRTGNSASAPASESADDSTDDSTSGDPTNDSTNSTSSTNSGSSGAPPPPIAEPSPIPWKAPNGVNPTGPVRRPLSTRLE